MSPSVSISILVLATFIPATFSLYLDISPITTSDRSRFDCDGVALVTGDGILLTTDEPYNTPYGNVGLATYTELLHLWDSASNKLADFSTQFSFVINASDGASSGFGDGLTFLLAPHGSTIEPGYDSGVGGLGFINATSFVAVVFDTHINPTVGPPQVAAAPVVFGPPEVVEGDLIMPRVGIDLNSVTSAVNTTWYNDITEGCRTDAWISYSSSAKMLRVNFTGCSQGIKTQGSLKYEVDLRDYLPAYVTVGFSAATSVSFQTHSVKSWSFSSTDVSSAEEPSPSRQPPPPQIVNNGGKDSKSLNNKIVAFGLSGVGILLLILASTFIFCFLLRNKKKKKKKKEQHEGLEEEQLSDSAMDNEFEKGNVPRRFSYDELVLATHDFAAGQKLGEGGFGNVYKGFLRATNTYIAVKKVSEGSKQGKKEYEAEVKIISQLRHKNLVQLIGTIGYMAPEYIVTGKASKETDIYSFGILLLEIACGRRPIDHRYPKNQLVLVEWVWSLYGGGQLLDAADAKVDSSEDEARNVARLMVAALWCVHPDTTQRPSIRKVVQLLIYQDRLPDLPLSMPKPMYDNVPAPGTPSSHTHSAAAISASSSNFTSSSAPSGSDLFPIK